MAAMTELEQLIEFSALLESWDMPSHLKTALIEALDATYEQDMAERPEFQQNAEYQSLPDHVKPAVLQQITNMERNHKILHEPFNIEQAITDISKQWHKKCDEKPVTQAYIDNWMRINQGKNAYNRATLAKQLRNAGIDVQSMRDARIAYYRAIADVVHRTYQTYKIPFDEAGFFQEMVLSDPYSSQCQVEANPAKRIYFENFYDANYNKDVQSLVEYNPAVEEIIKTCSKFLSDYRHDPHPESYLNRIKSINKFAHAPEHAKKAPVAQLDDDDQRQWDRQQARKSAELQRKQMRVNPYKPVAEQVNSIAEFRQRFPRMPYADLYHKYALHADPKRVEMAPRPDETVKEYFERVVNDGLLNAKAVGLVDKLVKAAYPTTNMNSVLATFRKDRDFNELYTKFSLNKAIELKSKGELSPELVPCFNILDTLKIIQGMKTHNDDIPSDWIRQLANS